MKNLICGLLFSISLAVPIASQEEELERMDAVEKLQSQLKAPSVEERIKAETELMKMGPPVLEFLESADDNSTTDYRERVARIRKQLETAIVNQVSKASKMTLKGKMTVGSALKQIKLQTQNQVTVTDPSYADIEFEIAVEDIEFWPAIIELMKQTDLVIDPFGGAEPGQLALTKSAADLKATQAPSTSKMIFHTLVTRVDSSVNLQQPTLDYSTVTLLVRWEPRLRPISVDIPMSSISILDEYEDEIKLPNQEEVVYGMVQPEIPQVEFALSLPRIDRQVESLKSIKARIDTLLPGKTEQFRFKKISKLKPGYSLQKAGAKVEFGGTRKNEDVYSIQMSISFEEENNALESHQSWVFQNDVYLIDNQGNREEAISLETLQQDNERVTIQYYFLEAPGDRTLIYKTPASIIKLPVEFELTKIPLP